MLRQFCIAFTFIVLFSCDQLADLRGKINWCDLKGRELTSEELSLVNFEEGDSTILSTDGDDKFYLTCTTKEYKPTLTTTNDKNCEGGQSKTSFYSFLAEYKTNIVNMDGSFLDIRISISTSPSFTEAGGNDPLPESALNIYYITSKKSTTVPFLRYATTPGSDQIKVSPLLPCSSEPCVQSSFVSHLSDTIINNHIFNSVYVFSTPKEVWTKTEVVEKLYYQKDLGIIRIIYRGKSYDFEEIFR